MLKSKEFLYQDELLKFVNDNDISKDVVSITVGNVGNNAGFTLWYTECKHEWTTKSERTQYLMSGDTVDVGPYYAVCSRCGFRPNNDKVK